MAIHDFKSQRLYVDAPLCKGAVIELERDQANYILNVLRLKQDDKILIFNGKDGEWHASLSVEGRKRAKLTADVQTRQQPEPPKLRYYFAPLKQARLDYMIQKAVELGVGVLQPVITQHTQVRKINDKRMQSNAIEAAEQCGILSLPQINTPLNFDAFINDFQDDVHLIFCDEDAPQANDLQKLVEENIDTLALIIGPEGGFSDEERATLSHLKQVFKLGLGPRIMRADTAAIAALALIQSHLGDWYE